MNKMLLLALGLLPAFATMAQANDRYRERPPVIVSPDLAAPWILQLGGGNVRPVVYPTRPEKPRGLFQPRT